MSTLEYRPIPVKSETVCLDPLAKDAVIDPASVIIVDSSPSFFGFSKVSKYHGRSIIDPEQKVIQQEPLTDEFGQVYFSFSIKGADASLPYASYDKLQPNKVRINGMLEASTFERCQMTSKHLREQGVLTEWPIFHAQPEYFPDEEDTDLETFQSYIYHNYLNVQYTKAMLGKVGVTPDSFGRVGLVGQGITELEFSVMYRAMLSNARIPDLHYIREEDPSSDKLVQELKNAIDSLQQRGIQSFKAYPALMMLDSSTDAGREQYLAEILPAIIGENLARFHNANCVHSFPHAGNWTLAGELVDLDTVECSDLYEDDIPFVDEDSRFNDLATTLLALEGIVSYANVDSYAVMHSFCDAYVSARFADKTTTESDRIILEAILRPVDYSQYTEVPMLAIIDDDEVNAAIESTLMTLEQTIEPGGIDSAASIFDLVSGKVLENLELEITIQVMSFVNHTLPRISKEQQDQVARILIARQKMKLLNKQVMNCMWQNIDEIHSRLHHKIAKT